MFEVIARMTDGTKEWPVTVWSAYKSIEEATHNALLFYQKYNTCATRVKCIKIEIGRI